MLKSCVAYTLDSKQAVLALLHIRLSICIDFLYLNFLSHFKKITLERCPSCKTEWNNNMEKCYGGGYSVKIRLSNRLL